MLFIEIAMHMYHLFPLLCSSLNLILLQSSSSVSAAPAPSPGKEFSSSTDIDAAIIAAKDSDEWKEFTSKRWNPTRYLKAVHVVEKQLPLIATLDQKYLNPPDDTHKDSWPKKPLLSSVDEFIEDQHALRIPYHLQVKNLNIMNDEMIKFFWVAPRHLNHHERWKEESIMEPWLSKYREMERKSTDMSKVGDAIGHFYLDTHHLTVKDLEKWISPEIFKKELQKVIDEGKTIEWQQKLGIESKLVELEAKKRRKPGRTVYVWDTEYSDSTVREAIHLRRLQEWNKYLEGRDKE